MTTPGETNWASPPPPPPPSSDAAPSSAGPVNSGLGGWETKSPWGQFVQWARETLDGFFEFFAMLFGGFAVLVGGWGRVGLSIGLACLAAGYGTAIEAREGSGGPFWMFVGAFLVGLVIPMGKCRH